MWCSHRSALLRDLSASVQEGISRRPPPPPAARVRCVRRGPHQLPAEGAVRRLSFRAMPLWDTVRPDDERCDRHTRGDPAREAATAACGVTGVRGQFRPRAPPAHRQLLRDRGRGRRRPRPRRLDGHLRDDHMARPRAAAGQAPHPAHRPRSHPSGDAPCHHPRPGRQRRDCDDRLQGPDHPARGGRAGGDPQAAGGAPCHQPEHLLRRRVRLSAHRDVLRHDLRPHRAPQRRAVLRPADGALPRTRRRSTTSTSAS